MNSIRIATYNIHKCVGMDRRYSPERIADVLRELEADVIGLQEVVCHSDRGFRDHQAEFLAEELGMYFCLGENRKHYGADYGNVILSRLPIVAFQNYDISITRREPRGCLRAEIGMSPDRNVHFVNLHLGTSFFERRLQVRKLLVEHVLDDPQIDGMRIIAGDFNEWIRGLTTRMFKSKFQSVDPKLHLGTMRTFPGIAPIVHLDHIYFDDAFTLRTASLHKSRRSLVASDHLPIVAELEF
ncbi:MAG TPA: endonuclease/exonuclease/phosphatase family protein [Pyrinomonadaceae bacterium]